MQILSLDLPNNDVNKLPDMADIIFCVAVSSTSTSSISPDMAIVDETPGMGSSPGILSCPWPLQLVSLTKAVAGIDETLVSSVLLITVRYWNWISNDAAERVCGSSVEALLTQRKIKRTRKSMTLKSIIIYL